MGFVLLVGYANELGVGVPLAFLGDQRVPQDLSGLSDLERLGLTLSKLYPIESSHSVVVPDRLDPSVPRFCWTFFRPAPEVYKLIGDALRSYQGKSHWRFHSSSGFTCVAASLTDSEFTGYPPLSLLDSSDLKSFLGSNSQWWPTPEFIRSALSEVPQLCRHIEKALALEKVVAKAFDPNLIAPSEPPSADSDLMDFLERGMHVPWIVSDPSEFVDRRVGSTDFKGKRLHFSVTSLEWSKIYFEVLGAATPGENSDVEEQSSTHARIGAPDYPLLSGIDAYSNIIFEPREIEALREECVRARASTRITVAIRGLDKLILMCHWAQRLKMGLYLACP